MSINMAWPRGWATCIFFALLVAFASAAQKEEGSDDDPGLNTYVTRPDITPTKWHVKNYHPDRLAPGYWFLGPYRVLDQTTFGHGWVGAHIFDGDGELVWSGANMFSKGNVEDFRISNVDGEYLMTMMDQGSRSMVILDNHYEVREHLRIDNFNSHELHFVDNGTRALVIRGDPRQAPPEMARTIGYNDGECHVQFEIFQELDVTNNYAPTFTWYSWGKVDLDESTLTEGSPARRCMGGPWDYLHLNAVDKTPEGDFLISGRHTDTLYKVSKDDGHIIWRLGGTNSDFPTAGDLYFTRQHDIRYRGQNETHLIVSILDNAKGIDHTHQPSYPYSRGLLLAINEKEMTYSIELQIDHPMTDDRYSWRRGNYQVLPNGNIFMGWSEQGVQSEHSADGELLMEAIFAVDWLGTYRQYKYPFVGLPKTLPDINSRVSSSDNITNTTTVHVSWNGATEVRTWELWKANIVGHAVERLASAAKKGFETKIEHTGYVPRVVVKGLDANGKLLGKSAVFRTLIGDEVAPPAGPGFFSLDWIFSSSLMAFCVGFAGSSLMLLVVWHLRHRGAFRRFRAARYYPLRHDKDDAPFEVFTEDSETGSLPSRGSRHYAYD